MSAQTIPPDTRHSSDLEPKTLPNERDFALGSTNTKITLQVEDPELVSLVFADLARSDGKSIYKILREDLEKSAA
jgi:hypothetical protein